MSSHDIDSTSENVLHDWEQEESADDTETPEDDGRAWGAAAAEPDEAMPAGAVETQTEGEEVSEALETVEAEEQAPEPGEAEPEDAPMHVERCTVRRSFLFQGLTDTAGCPQPRISG